MRAVEAGLLSVECLKGNQTSVHAAQGHPGGSRRGSTKDGRTSGRVKLGQRSAKTGEILGAFSAPGGLAENGIGGLGLASEISLSLTGEQPSVAYAHRDQNDPSNPPPIR